MAQTNNCFFYRRYEDSRTIRRSDRFEGLFHALHTNSAASAKCVTEFQKSIALTYHKEDEYSLAFKCVQIEEDSMSLVSLVKIKNGNSRDAISASLSLINFQFPRSIRRVAIKANLCYYWDSTTGQTTDPRFIGALIDLIRHSTSPDTEISIVESDASAMRCKHAFKFLGYEKLSEDYNVDLVNLSEDTGDSMRVSTGGRVFNFVVPHTIQKADLRINVPKIKYTTEKLKITCALKNIFHLSSS